MALFIRNNIICFPFKKIEIKQPRIAIRGKNVEKCTVLQSQMAVSAHLQSKQLLPFVFARQSCLVVIILGSRISNKDTEIQVHSLL